jgi:hypothetical protein
MRKNIIDRRNAEYSPLIDDFKDEVKDLNLKGITGPHFPSIGECYEDAKYKFAFCGMETYGWNKMPYFMEQKPDSYLTESDTLLNNYEHLTWAANWHATFWGFVFKFLARFYNVDFKELIGNENSKELRSILKSFVWGETNAIERFDVTSKYEGGNPEVWSIVKQASKSFDDLNHIINSCSPNVVFIVHSGASKEYFLNDGSLSEIFGVDVTRKNNVLHLKNEKMNYDYFYLRNSDTHLFKLPHPTWMGLYSGIGIDKYVDSLYNDISNYHVWDTLPLSPKDRVAPEVQILDKFSRERKYQIIASLAQTLIQNNIVMSGKEIQDLFNMNGIKTQYGTPFGDNGGRGIHKLISSAWKFYQDNGDYQTAYNIARAFVNQNGEYAYW